MYISACSRPVGGGTIEHNQEPRTDYRCFREDTTFLTWRRGTQQAVSVNIGSEDLLSPTIFWLKCDEKLEYLLCQILVICGGIKMSFWLRKKARPASIFRKATAARKFG